MKKLFLIATVALGLGAMTSCNSKCKVEADPQADTLAACMGEMYGFGVAGQMQNMNDSTFDKKEFLAGLQMMLKMDESKSSYVQGVQMGAQVKGMFEQLMERENVDINAKRWLASFKKAFMSDSLQDPSKYQIEVMRLVRELSNKVKAQDPKAIANKNNAEKFIADSLANNPDVKKSEGGVYYKVVKEGKGEKFTATDRINVKYTGRHLDGTEFEMLEFWKRVPFVSDSSTRSEFFGYSKINPKIAWATTCIGRLDNFTKVTLPEDNKIIMKTSNRTLYINRENGLPEKMEIQDTGKKTAIYILYNEVNVNS